MKHSLSSLLAISLTTLTAAAADWPGWRGPTGMGQSDDKNLPLTWGGKANANVLWKVPLPGQDKMAAQDQNQSSPIVVGDRVFIATSYWAGKKDPKQVPEHHVACYRTTDGQKLWDTPIAPGPWLFGDLRGGYTAPTPAADAERVYVVFGSSVIAALDHAGKLVWRKTIAPFKFDVALAASPVLFGETVILQCDENDRQSRLIAFDRKTGATAWEEKRPTVGFAHSTPVLAAIGGKTQLLVSASNALQGVDPANGKVLWTCAAKGDTVSPVFGNGIAYIDTGRGGPAFAIDPTGIGDVTKTHLKWKINNLPEGYGSPVAAGEYLYRLHSQETLRCMKLATGEVMFTERLPGVSVPSSPIASNGLLYLVSGGKSYVVKAGPKLEILSVNDLGDGGPASPAAANGKLYIKGRKWLFCVGTATP
ncbi:MAG TPA: PQQ-binding-like beta-propeller repeat protein [Urbifossiella sp.]|nr:PQQ-binding-like beta-propeller repeat protein [Urbifossiella sp.]